jgi:hypothetical protein
METNMKTYLAQIETPSGVQQTQLVAININDAKAQIDARLNSSRDESVRYTIQEQPPIQRSDTDMALLNASGGLFGCLLLLVVADYQLRRYFKE